MSDWIDAETHADRALDWYERGRWAEAEAELRKAIALSPDHAEWHYNLGMTLEAAGRDAEALACYEHAVSLAPGQAEPLVAAGIVCNRLGRHAEAIDLCQQAIRLERTCEPAYAHKMESHLRLGDHDEVETTFYLAQADLPDPSAHCLAVMAESLMDRRLYERSEWCLKEALRHEPTMPRLRARLAAVFAATGRPQRALQLYLRDLRDDPGNIDTLLDFGELLLSQGRLPDASEKFRRVLELEPANVDAHYQLGRIAMTARRFEQAHLEFELVLKLDAEFPGIRVDLAEALLRRNRTREARLHLSQELDELRAADEKSSAEQTTADAVPAEAAARSASGLVRFGGLLLEAGQAREAAIVLERALARGQAGDADLYRILALAHFQAGERDRGVVASRRALRLDRRCIRSMHNLALAALEADRLVIADGWIRRGLAVDRHDIGLRRLRMRLWTASVLSAVRTGRSAPARLVRALIRV
jgi:Tfp pilus assembly protein PilF